MQVKEVMITPARGQKFGRISDGGVKLFQLCLLPLVLLKGVAQAQVQSGLPTDRPIAGQIEVAGSDLHLVFSGRDNWQYLIKQEADKISLQIPQTEDAFIPQIKTVELPWLKSVIVTEGIDKSLQVVLELKEKESGVKYFDYLTDDPSRLVVDFFLDEKLDPKAAPKKSNSTKPKSVNSPKEGKKPQAPAGFPEDGNSLSDASDPGLKRFDVADYEVNAKALIASKRNIYLRFPPSELDWVHYKKMKSLPPVYEISAQETDENKQARLLLTLFQKKRFATFQHTLKLFRDQFPDSQYDQMLSYIDAEIEESKWHQSKDPDQFELMATKYSLLIDRYPNSSLAVRTMMLMGYLFLERGQNLKAMSMFQRFVDQNPKSTEVPRAKLEIARAFIGMKKMEDARDVLTTIHGQYPNTKEAVEAHFLLGDTYFLENRYADAIGAYEQSEKLYPQYLGQFPNLYNKAESLFWSQNYRSALDSFRMFLQRFPQSDHGGYAMTRIGETLEILGAPTKKRDGAYLESIYRYRTSPGGNVARVRMAAQRMPSMKEKEIEKVREEIEDFRQKAHLTGLDAFTRLLIADGFFNRKEYDRSLPLLIEYYQKNPTSDQLPLFQQRIINHIVEKIRAVVDKNDSIQALQLYGQYSGNWLKNVARLDLKYLLGRSFEIAGVPAEAEKFYRQVQEGMVGLQGSKEGDERAVFEQLPILNEVHVRLAKALIDQKKDADAEVEIRKAEGATDLTETAKVESVEVQSRVAEARGNMRKAIDLVSALIESWKGDAANVARAYLRQAELFSKLQDFANAEKALNKIQNLDGEVSDELRASAMEVKGGIQLKKGDWQAAAKTWSELLEKSTDSIGPAEVRYQLGKIYFEHGQMNEARTTWSLLDRPETTFWYKLAQEKLQDSDWKSGYKKYIDRIPALNPKKTDGGKK